MENNRGQWSGNLGFTLAAIGSTIGIGNLWSFPYRMGANGGLAFLAAYLAIAACCGVVLMGLEMAIGRRTKKSPILALASFGKQYKIFGILSVACAFIIMGFYSVIIGYSLRYAAGFALEAVGRCPGFSGMDGGTFFGHFTGDVSAVALYTFIILFICSAIVSLGVKGGIEKFNRITVPAIFITLADIFFYSLTLPGASEGLKFMFTKKGLQIAGTRFSLFQTVRAAGNQALLSLSLGAGCMITYGSYLDEKSNISKNAWIIPAADTVFSILAGLAVFPAVFAMGQAPNEGSGLLFITLHNTFLSMGRSGNILGIVFYTLVVFAGISSAVSFMETAVSDFIDRSMLKGSTIGRKKATALAASTMFFLSLWICCDRLGAHSSWLPFTEGLKDIFGLYSFLTEGLFMPLAAIAMCAAIGWGSGFGFMKEEVEKQGGRFYTEGFFRICIKYITPALMSFILLSLAASFFGK